MLRSSILVAIVACIVAVYAPTVFPALLQAMSGGTSDAPMAANAGARPAQASASLTGVGEDRMIEIAADGGGQYSTDVVINGVVVHMLVDTGATTVALSAETAQRLSLPLSEASYTALVHTANGVARAAPIVLPAVSVGNIYVPAVQGLVLERRAGRVDLLGMSFLKRLSSVEQRSGRLVLRQ